MQLTPFDIAAIDRAALAMPLLHDEHVVEWMWDTSDWDEEPASVWMQPAIHDHRDRNILRWDEEYSSRECDQMEYDKRDHQAHVAVYDQIELDRYTEHALFDHDAHVVTRFRHQYSLIDDADIPF